MNNIETIMEVKIWELLLASEGLAPIDDWTAGPVEGASDEEIEEYNHNLDYGKLEEMDRKFQDLQFHRWLKNAFI